jgi:hypothetical protein
MDQTMEYLPNEMAEMKAAISASLDEMKVNTRANQEKYGCHNMGWPRKDGGCDKCHPVCPD